MATTTNYGWTTPDDTALVKDGAAAIRTLGSSIDTTTKNLNPQTTTGAIAYRSSTSNVNTSLPIGTAGQVLTVNSGATAPEWATPASGGMTLLSTTSLSGATTTISSISGSYNSLFLVIFGNTAAANGYLRLAPNGTTNISGYGTVTTGNSNNTALQNDNYIYINGGSNPMTGSNANNSFSLSIHNYASTTSRKPISFVGGFESSDNGYCGVTGFGQIKTTSAITSLVFSNSGGNSSAGTVLLYGVK